MKIILHLHFAIKNGPHRPNCKWCHSSWIWNLQEMEKNSHSLSALQQLRTAVGFVTCNRWKSANGEISLSLSLSSSSSLSESLFVLWLFKPHHLQGITEVCPIWQQCTFILVLTPFLHGQFPNLDVDLPPPLPIEIFSRASFLVLSIPFSAKGSLNL